MIRLSIIVAATATNGIGKNGRLPWHIHEDLRYFAHVTQHAPQGTQNAVIMGRKTWESIPAKYRPLSKRFNIVISSDPDYKLNATPETAVLVSSLEEALKVESTVAINRSFVIGGASLYSEVLQPSSTVEVDWVLVTRITAPEYDCDTWMPEFTAQGKWKRESHEALVKWVGFDVPAGVQKQEDVEYEFQLWARQDQKEE